MKIFVAIAFLFIIFTCSASTQSKDATQESKQLSSKLSALNQKILDAYGKQQKGIELKSCKKNSCQDNRARDFIPTKLEDIMNDMRALQQEYRDNPYITIKGFDITLGILPSVTVSLEFKQ